MNISMNSGLYKWLDSNGESLGELRLDVDGDFPQMAASGFFNDSSPKIHWIACPLNKTQTANKIRWTGKIKVKFKEDHLEDKFTFKQDASEVFPYTKVSIRRKNNIVKVRFSGPGTDKIIREYKFKSRFFREVYFEYDAEQNTVLTLDYRTNSHPHRHDALPAELLTIDTVFERAGFHVIRTGRDTIVPSRQDDTNTSWSNAEMHDAMQNHFSRIKELPPNERDRAQWALWTFFAGIHDKGSDLGGIMFDFDSIDAAHRQGTAVFVDSFISKPPDNDPTPEAWKRRMTFWTAVHEMGHAFNLRHAWLKPFGNPWLPQEINFDLQSFMNYPSYYQSGLSPSNGDANTIRFFKDFMFRFSEKELLFLRHAPEPFVQMGNSDFAVNHAFEQARISPAPAFSLELRTNRNGNEFEFLEPVMIELKLTNQSGQPQLVDKRLLEFSEQMTVIVQRRGSPQMSYHPFAHMLYKQNVQVLEPKKSMYAPLFVSVGGNGWMIENPGWYEVRICLHMDVEDIISNRLRIRVAPPLSWDEEYLAQDFFCDEVGRTFSFDGSCCLTKANDVLIETTERLKNRKVAIHSKVALNIPKARNFKVMIEAKKGRMIREIPPDEKAVDELAKILGSTPGSAKLAAEALGHIDYNQYVQTATSALNKMEKVDLSLKVTKNMYSVFKERKVNDNVLMEIRKLIKKAES